MASVNGSTVTFSHYTNYATRNWVKRKQGSINYISSPNRDFSNSDAQEQEKFTQFLAGFFEVKQIPITYYSCVNAEELFRVRGFDFNMQMFLHKTGGQAGFNNDLYSGNNRDIYNHEVVHLYLNKAVKGKINSLLNEGLATYMGGSNEMEYSQHRANLLSYIIENPDFDFAQYLNAYDTFYINQDSTSVPYTVGALICELAYKECGKDLLLQMIGEPDIDKAFALLGLNKANLNQRLRALLKHQVYLIPGT